MLTLNDIPLHHKRVLVRVDFNVPIENGIITNDSRIKAHIPTIRQLQKHQVAIMLVSHLGRPKEGVVDLQFSLKTVAEHLSQLLQQPVRFAHNWIDDISIQPNEIVVCENVRFLKGEESNDDTLAQKMAKLCDVFVMDAFATAHRAQASTVGIAQYAPVAVAGPLLLAETKALATVLNNPKRPVVAIVGGAKVSTKLKVLEYLLNKVDSLILGGGIANTFLAALAQDVGNSLYEPELVPMAQKLLKDYSNKIITPEDMVKDNTKILDIGQNSIITYTKIIQSAQTIIWNGPVGVFEIEAFAKGTEAIAKAIANSQAYTLAGGGETIAAIEKYHLSEKISYISTGGGAFLECLEGKVLPAVQILEERTKLTDIL